MKLFPGSLTVSRNRGAYLVLFIEGDVVTYVVPYLNFRFRSAQASMRHFEHDTVFEPIEEAVRR